MEGTGGGLSALGEHAADKAATVGGFHRVRPQVLGALLRTLRRAIGYTVANVGAAHIHEPRFTRQLLLDLQRARDEEPASPRYDITHQPEHVVADQNGIVQQYFRLDLRVLFSRQLGRTGDHVCLEFKYLDTADRGTDMAYVDDGVHRFVTGDYGRGHHWAVMVGLERRGPLTTSAGHVDCRLIERYGLGFKARACVNLPDVHETEHIQADGPHSISILHALCLIIPSLCHGPTPPYVAGSRRNKSVGET